jgi:hypothetical protein
MNQTLMIILVLVIVIFVVMSQVNENFYESFMPHDPLFSVNSCKSLTREKKKVNKLSSKYCNNSNDINKITNKDRINKDRTCYNITEKKIMLDAEQESWCSKITPEQLKQIEEELGTEVEIVEEGPNYMNIQYYQNQGVNPYDLSGKFASFENNVTLGPSPSPGFN